MGVKQGWKGLWIAVAAAALDRVTKIIVSRLDSTVTLLPNIVSIRHVTNSGMAFSLLSGRTLLLTLLTAVIIAALAAWLIVRPNRLNRAARIGLWMVVGGGLGNLYDRLTTGAVIDFIQLDFVNFAIFNAADIFVVCGAILTLIALMAEEHRKEPKA